MLALLVLDEIIEPLKHRAKFVSGIILFFFPEKISLDISYKSSAWHVNQMKCKDLFSLILFFFFFFLKIFRMLSATKLTWHFKGLIG